MSDKKLNLTTEGDQGLFKTIQFEGKYTGVPSLFIRLSGCNLRCSWRDDSGEDSICDSPHSSFAPDRNMRTVKDIVEQAHAYQVKHIVITGGEPYLQANVVDLIDELVKLKHHITIESNGSIYRETNAHFISLSPKLASSSHAGSSFHSKHEKRRYNPEALHKFIKEHDCQLKFVISKHKDFQEVQQFVEAFKLSNELIHLMPEGKTVEGLNDKARWIIQYCNRYGFNYSDRLQIRIFGKDKKGV